MVRAHESHPFRESRANHRPHGDEQNCCACSRRSTLWWLEVPRPIHKHTRNRLPSDRIFNSDVMSNQARIDDMTMQIKVRIHPDRAPPPPDMRAARRDLRDPREVFFPPSHATISVFLRRRRDAAGPPRADPRAPLSFEQNAHLRVGSGFIQYPPQRPFAQPVQVQPPTLSVRSSDTFSQVFAGFSPRVGIDRRGSPPPARRGRRSPRGTARSRPRSSQMIVARVASPRSHRWTPSGDPPRHVRSGPR